MKRQFGAVLTRSVALHHLPKCSRPCSSRAPPYDGSLDEEVPQNAAKKVVHDFATFRTHRAVYGAGLCSTGSLAIEKLITIPTSPEMLHSPKRIAVLNESKIKRVAAGFGFSLFASSKELYGAGLNNFYQIGGPTRSEARTESKKQQSKEWYFKIRRIPLPEDSGKIVDMSAGRLHSVVGTTTGKVFCIGSNSHGQCGMNPATREVVAHNLHNELKPLPFEFPSEIRQVHCCLDTSFVLLENGQLFAWGLGTDGQLGNGNLDFQWVPKQLRGDLEGEMISRIGGTTDTLVAFSMQGDLFIWGQNEYGQMGVVSDEPQIKYPRHIPFKLGKVTGAAATGSSCLVCNSKGEAFSWGSEVLGFGPKVRHLARPMQLDPPLFQSTNLSPNNVEWVYAGGSSMGAVTQNGTMFTWGANRHGSLALGHHKHQYFPYQIFLPHGIKHASLGHEHSLFLLN